MADTADRFASGVEAFKASDFDKAIVELEAATHLNQDNYKAFCYLGAAYAAKQRYNAAVGAFKIAEQIAPGVASIHYNIAQAYEADGVDGEAEYEYEKALAINPGYTLAKEAMTRLKRRLNHV
jgi:tetratricopeptide (TPR) repeat protein